MITLNYVWKLWAGCYNDYALMVDSAMGSVKVNARAVASVESKGAKWPCNCGNIIEQYCACIETWQCVDTTQQNRCRKRGPKSFSYVFGEGKL